MLRVQFLLLLYFVSLNVFALSARAGETTSNKFEKVFSEKRVSDRGHDFILREGINRLGEYEVRVIFALGKDQFSEETRTVLIGRAINVPAEFLRDANGAPILQPRRVTTWFMPKSLKPLAAFVALQTEDDPWPTALGVMRERIVSPGWFEAHVLGESLAASASLAFSHHKQFYQQINQEMIDLYDFTARTDELERLYPNDPFVQLNRQRIALAWQDIDRRMIDEKNFKLWLNAGGDVALMVFGAKVAGVVARVAGRAGGVVLRASHVNEVLAKLSGQLTKSVKFSTLRALKRLKLPVAALAPLALAAQVTKLTAHEVVRQCIGFLEAQGLIGRFALRSMGLISGLAKGGLREIKYVGLAQTLQVAAEVSLRPQDLFDPNPIVMSQKMLGDKDFVQNVAYMTNETFWMAGAGHKFGAGWKALAVGGVIALADSVTMSILIKGETKPQRVAFDTGWETTIGNMQTSVLDSWALQAARRAAIATGSAHLRLAGYLVAIVDQSAGYLGYAKLTHWIERSAGPSSVGHAAAKEEKQKETDEIQNPKLKLIPIYVPAA